MTTEILVNEGMTIEEIKEAKTEIAKLEKQVREREKTARANLRRATAKLGAAIVGMTGAQNAAEVEAILEIFEDEKNLEAFKEVIRAQRETSSVYSAEEVFEENTTYTY